MDFRRLILYFALTMVGMVIWQTWQQDYGPEAKQAAQQQAAISADVPDSEQDADVSNSDIPSVPSATQRAANPKAIVNDTSVSKHLIKVTTDTVEFWIDKRGGNVVQANLLKYPESLENKQTPVELLSHQPDTLYQAQSGLISSNGPDKQNGQGLYTSDRDQYVLADGQDSLVVPLRWSKGGVSVTKNFVFKRKDYAVDVNYQVANNSGKAWRGHAYMQLKRKQKEGSTRSTMLLDRYSVAYSDGDKHTFEKIRFDKVGKRPLDMQASGGWAAMLQRYFLSAWVPAAGQTYHYYTKDMNNGIAAIGMVGSEVEVAAGATKAINSKLYVGPAVADNLEKLAKGLDLAVDYGWLWFISVFLFWLLKHIHAVVGNWGWSIILITVMIKALFYKLSEQSFKSMNKMRKLQPRIQALKERFGDDRQAMGQAMMQLYRDEKINPLGGCLPMLVQIPVFIALYWVLLESVELRQAPFMFWIHDLSVKDPYFILPVAMGISMLAQQKMMPAPPDPMQAKIMMFLPVIFTVMFLSFPSGLVLYWLANNLLTIAQQSYNRWKHDDDRVSAKKVPIKKSAKNDG